MSWLRKSLFIILTLVVLLLAQIILELTFGYLFFSASETRLAWLGERENLNTLLLAHFVISGLLIIPSIWLPLIFYRE